MRRLTDTGSTLIEVLVATATASVVMAATVALLAISANAVSESELETTATWLAVRTVEEWRTSADMADEGRRMFSREGREVGEGLFVVRWEAHSAPDAGTVSRVSVLVTSPRLPGVVTITTLVPKGTP